MKKKLILFISLALVIVIGIFVVVQAEGESEVIENLTYTSYSTNTLDLGNNSFAQTSYLGYVNYYNGSEFMPINTTIVESSDLLFDYEVIEGVYQAYFKSDPTWGPVVKFIKNDVEITFQPMGLLYEGYYGGLEEISMIQDVVGSPNRSIFLYKNAYGDGIDLQYSYYNELLKENLIISQLSDLPSPPQYMIDQGNITLNLDFVLETDSNHIIIEGAEWDKKTDITTSNEVYIKNESGDIIYYLSVPYAYDSYGSVQLLEYQFKKQGNSLYVTIKTPYSWLNEFERGYPVYIDPSTAYTSPGTMANDASFGSLAWSEYNNAKASDNVYAHRAALRNPGQTNYLKATNFGFTIPTGSTIDGIKARVERHCSTAEGAWTIRLRAVKGGTIQSTDMDSSDVWPGSDASITYGGTTNKWGTTWTPAQINAANFGFVLAAYVETGIARVDWMNVRIYYTEPPAVENFYVNVGDSWRTATDVYVNVGDIWRDVEYVAVNVGDSWRVIYSI